MFIKWLTGLIKGKKRRERAKVEIEELKKALLEDPKFRDEVLRELEYRTGRRDLLKAGVLGLLGFTVGSMVGGEAGAVTQPVNSSVARDVVSDYAVKIPKPCTCIVAQDGTGDYDVSPGEDASEVIQKAIDYAYRRGGGHTVIKHGIYEIYNSIYIRDRMYLSGSGSSSLIKLGNNVNRDIITSEPKTYREVIISNIRLDGNKNHNYNGCGIYCRLWDSVIQNVFISNMPKHGIDLRNMGLCDKSIAGTRDDNKIIACSIRDCRGVGIYTSAVLKIIGCDIGHNNIYVCENAVRIQSCNIYGATIWIENKEAVSVVGNHITADGRTNAAIKILARNGYTCRDIEIVGNDIRGRALEDLINISSHYNSLVSNIVISNNTFNARENRHTPYGIRLVGAGKITNILITNNIFSGTYTKGLFANKTKNKLNIIFTGNIEEV